MSVMAVRGKNDFQQRLRRICASKIAVNLYCKDHQCTKVSSLKPKQVEALFKAERGDVLAILPTGYGKSLIYELIPYYTGVLRCLDACTCVKPSICSCNVYEHVGCVIVITPLNAIIAEKLRHYGDMAVQVSDTSAEDEQFHAASYRYVLSHPEHVLRPDVLTTLKNTVWQQKSSHVIIDEAHCVVTWGESFRKDFQELYKHRATLPREIQHYVTSVDPT